MKELIELRDQQGWNETTLLVLCLDFIQQHYAQQFLNYCKERAQFENRHTYQDEQEKTDPRQ